MAERLESRVLLASSPAIMVTDLKTAPVTSQITNLTDLNGTAIFTATGQYTGQELYCSDGTAAGTYLIKDINPGTVSSNPSNLAVSNGILYFSADDGAHGRELWRSDGTANGTYMVTDVEPGVGSSSPADLTDVNGTLFFVAYGPGGEGLYKTDGTSAGAQLLTPAGAVDPGEVYRAGGALVNRNGTVFFPGYDAAHGYELWKSDGTPQGTGIVADLTPGAASSVIGNLNAVGSSVYFTLGTSVGSIATTIYKSDGTAAGTMAVYSFPSLTDFSDFTSFGGRLLFRASPFSGGESTIWTSDGTAAGTTQFHDGGAWNSYSIVASGGKFYFDVGSTSGSSQASALWESDGTSVGTSQLGSFNNSGLRLTDVRGELYFVTSDSLYKTDGTSAGTTLLATGLGQVTDSASAAGALFLAVQDSATQSQLFRSDGTPGGTGAVTSILGGNAGSAIENLIVAGSNLFFDVREPTGYSLFATDGSAPGASLLRTFASAIGSETVVNRTLFFAADNQLWKSDGTAAGTQAFGSFPDLSMMTLFEGSLYFGTSDSNGNPGLWKSNGTAAGTVQIAANVTPGRQPASLGNVLYFDEIIGDIDTLWRSDGTAVGTSRVMQLPAQSYIAKMMVVGSQLFLAVSDGSMGQVQLWRSDGTAQGTINLATIFVDVTPSGDLIPNMVAFNGQAYFSVALGLSVGLWRTDGTAAGTQLVTNVPRDNFEETVTLTVLNGQLLFFAPISQPSAPVLWKSDGTAPGTMPVATGLPPHTIIAPTIMPQLENGYLFFLANNRGSVWRTDGTATGTAMLTDQSFVPIPSDGMAAVNRDLYFVADDGIHGDELWKILQDYSPVTAQLSPVDASPRFAPIDQLTITFNRPVVELDLADLVLTRTNSPDLLSTNQTLTTPDGGTTWVLGNLGPITSVPGIYELTLKAVGTGIADPFGVPFTTSQYLTFTVAAPASIAGSVFNDQNNNGAQDMGEASLAGIAIYVDVNNNGTLDAGETSTTTDAAGNYSFTGLLPGTYAVRQIAPAGWAQTAPLLSGQGVTVASGQAAAGPVFGNVQISTVTMNFAYLMTVARSYGEAGTFASGDLNGDSTVNLADLLLVAHNYGHPLAGAAAAVAGSSNLMPTISDAAVAPRKKHSPLLRLSRQHRAHPQVSGGSRRPGARVHHA